jgi:hypothetical protein
MDCTALRSPVRVSRTISAAVLGDGCVFLGENLVGYGDSPPPDKA